MYLQREEEQNGIQSGLLGDPAQLAQTLGQYGAQAQQQAAQAGRQREADMQQAAAMSQQAEQQRQAEEARKRQQIMQIGMMIAGGGLGGGGTAAEGAAMQPVDNLMAQVAPEEFLKREMATGGINKYANLLGGQPRFF